MCQTLEQYFGKRDASLPGSKEEDQAVDEILNAILGDTQGQA
jgi:hypothetical protein